MTQRCSRLFSTLAYLAALLAGVGVMFPAIAATPVVTADGEPPIDAVTAEPTEGAPQVAGACCYTDRNGLGQCKKASTQRCAALGGIFMGRQTDCRDIVCEAGACCTPFGPGPACEIATPATCTERGGSYQGNGTRCELAFCPPKRGSCCVPTHSCFIDTEQSCLGFGGTYRGDGSECYPPCPGEPTGGCCAPSAGGGSACLVTSSVDCVSRQGRYWGNGTDCATRPCPPEGACCLGADRSQCATTTQAGCGAQGGMYLGDATTCGVGTCPPAQGACCAHSGPSTPYMCVLTIETQCMQGGLGHWLGNGSTCTVSCEDLLPGACCLPSPTGTPTCRNILRSECLALGGDWVGAGYICGYAPYCG